MLDASHTVDASVHGPTPSWLAHSRTEPSSSSDTTSTASTAFGRTKPALTLIGDDAEVSARRADSRGCSRPHPPTPTVVWQLGAHRRNIASSLARRVMYGVDATLGQKIGAGGSGRMPVRVAMDGPFTRGLSRAASPSRTPHEGIT